MTFKVKAMSALCELDIFTINGQDASYHDFGHKRDLCPEKSNGYDCGNMQFMPFDSVPDAVLSKYGISASDAKKIQAALKKALSFGYCGWCE